MAARFSKRSAHFSLASPSHKARTNSSQRPALSQGYRNMYGVLVLLYLRDGGIRY